MVRDFLEWLHESISIHREGFAHGSAFRSLGLQLRIFVATSGKLHRVVLCNLLCCLLCWLAASCGGSSSSKSSGSGGAQGGLQFTAPATSPVINLGQTVTLTVNENVTWMLQSGGLGKPVGSLANPTSTSVSYVAPPATTQPSCVASSAPGSPEQVVVLATSTADPTKSATQVVTIVQNLPCVPPPFLYASGCPPAGTVIQPPLTTQLSQVGIYTSFSVYDGGGHAFPPQPWGVPPFSWQIASGSLPDGLALSPGTDTSNVVISGTPTTPGCSTAVFQIADSTGVVSPPATYNFVVIPTALKVQVPTYPLAFNYGSAGNPGVPYQPIALSVSLGQPPYSWSQDVISYLPGGLNLSPSSSPVGDVIISGTPSAGANTGGNGSSGAGLGAYPTILYVSDSQQPYPAFGSTSLGNMAASVLPTYCAYAGDISPNPTNGGIGSIGVPGYSYLTGQVAFMLRGFDANGPVAIAGSVTLDGAGNITGGVEDVTRSTGSQSLTILPAGSSYTVGVVPDASISNTSYYNRGCMNLANSAGTTTTFAFTLSSCSNHYIENDVTSTSDNACGMKQNGQQNVAAGVFTSGRVIEFDDSTGQGTRASGILRLQDSTSFSSAPGGPYAFGLSGGDATAGHYAAAGSFTASSGTLGSVAADINDAGALQSALTGGSGSLSAVDTNGRATGSLSVGSASFDLAFYVVGKNEILMATTDPLSASHPILGGESIATGTSFSDASLVNAQIFHIGGLAAGGPDVSIGVLSFDGIGDVSGTVYQDQAATLGTTSISGVYQVDPKTGRTPFSAPGLGQTLGAHPFVAYVIPVPADLLRASCSSPASCVTGFLVGTDNTAQSGVMDFQTPSVAPPPPFSNRFVEGDYAYGTDETLDTRTPNIEGDVTPHPSASSSTSGSISGEQQDFSTGNANYCLQETSCLLLIPDETLSGSYSVNTNGTGTFGGETVSVTNGNVIFFIDESPLDVHPSVIVAEQ
jgi:hypothetical protein